jgi:hypothetical protein
MLSKKPGTIIVYKNIEDIKNDKSIININNLINDNNVKEKQQKPKERLEKHKKPSITITM